MKNLTILLLAFSFTLVLGSSNAEGSTHKKDELAYYREFTPTKLYEYIKLKGIKFPDVVFSQAILETGHFSSEVFAENHNLFGMRQPKVRETTATGTNLKHATYENWMKSVDDYKLWQDYVLNGKKIKSNEGYLNFLDGYGYAEAGNYKNTVKKMMKNYAPKYRKNNEYWEARVEKGTSININA